MVDAADEQKLERYRLVIDAVKLSLARHSVTLLIWDLDVDTPVNAGSATCIELGNTRYLLTAAHVVQDKQGRQVSSNAIGVVFRPQDGNNSFVRKILAVGGRKEDPLDIALLELSEEGANEIAMVKDFVPETRILKEISANSSQLFAVYGAPKDLSPLSLVDQTFKAGPMCYVTVSYDPFPSRLDPSCDIALEYNKTSNVSASQDGIVDAPDPRGVSGGGIWLVTECLDGTFWDPSTSQLIGVHHTWLPQDELIWGTQVQFAVSLLGDADPICDPDAAT